MVEQHISIGSVPGLRIYSLAFGPVAYLLGADNLIMVNPRLCRGTPKV